MRDARCSRKVLERAFAVPDLFTAERPEWTMTEIARAALRGDLGEVRRRGWGIPFEEANVGSGTHEEVGPAWQ